MYEKMELKLSGRGKERDAEIISISRLQLMLKDLQKEKKLDAQGDKIALMWIKLCKRIGEEAVSANYQGREMQDTFTFSFEHKYVRLLHRKTV